MNTSIGIKDTELYTNRLDTEIVVNAAEVSVNNTTDTNVGNIILELYKAFQYFNKDFFDNKLQEPIITIQKAKPSKKDIVYGWCSVSKIWRNTVNNTPMHEINLTAEGLVRGKIDTLVTLLHECIHLYHLQYNIEDTKKKGVFHNENFKTTAEQIGFEVEFDKKIGWSTCYLTPELYDKFNSYDINEDVFKITLINRKYIHHINESRKARNKMLALRGQTSLIQDEIDIPYVEGEPVYVPGLEFEEEKKKKFSKKQMVADYAYLKEYLDYKEDLFWVKETIFESIVTGQKEILDSEETPLTINNIIQESIMKLLNDIPSIADESQIEFLKTDKTAVKILKRYEFEL